MKNPCIRAHWAAHFFYTAHGTDTLCARGYRHESAVRPGT